MKSHLLFVWCVGVSILAHCSILRVPVGRSSEALSPTAYPAVRLVLAARPPEPEPEQPVPVTAGDESFREEDPIPEPKTETAPDVVDPTVPEAIVISREAVEEVADEYWSGVCREIAARLRYPLSARRALREDRVVVSLEIGGDGRLVSLHEVASRGHPALTRAVLSAVRSAAPFPPPPGALGSVARAELPVRFKMER